MAYQIDRFNGTFLVNVEDGSIESNVSDLRFVGKNYAGYGEVQNENFLHMLENFANTTPPPKVISGQIWFDSAEKKLKYYDGTRFRLAGGAEIGSTAPSGLAVGEFWFDTSAKQLYTWTGTDYILIGPEASPTLGAAGAVPQVVKDTLNNNHTVLKLLAGGKTIAILNQDDEFTLNSSQTPIEDFSLIKKGITLAKTNSSGVTTDNFYFWGTSSNADKLGGVAANLFLRSDVLQPFQSTVFFNDDGFQVGNGNDLLVKVENNDEVIIENRLNNPITIRISDSGTTDYDVGVFTNTGLRPGDSLAFDLGTTVFKWRQVHAGSIFGNVTGNVIGNVTGNARGDLLAAPDGQKLIDGTTKQIGYTAANLVGVLTGSLVGNVDGTASNASKLNDFTPSITVPSISNKTSVPVRDNLGNMYAVQFVGTTDKADRMKIDDTAVDTDPNYRSAKVQPIGTTIVARNGDGDILANLFQGTATTARYADLAEKYLADAEYEIGTVVAVGGEKEVTAAKLGERALGVVSGNPAYMMNSELEGGTYVALKGRVPVKVVGAVRKGDRLISTNTGHAIRSTHHTHSDAFAIALESDAGIEVRLIEAVIL
jgi:hypothetical protein